MIRPSLLRLLGGSPSLLVASVAVAQAPLPLHAEKIPGAVKNAGIYHVATGTWTRTGGQVANLGPDTIYSNTAGSSYFTSAGAAGGFAPGAENVDEGGLPGRSNGNPFTGGAGPDRDCYRVNGFMIEYCDMGAPSTGGWELSFYEEYDPCTVPASAPVATIDTGPIPASGCWTIVIDLTGSGQEFEIRADGSGNTWDDDESLDSFAWSHRYSGTDGSAEAGFFLNGDPGSTDPTWTPGAIPTDGTNTYYGAASLCGGAGTGYLTQDLWWLSDPTSTYTNCYFFGGYVNQNGCGGPQGNPYASFAMEIYADPGPCVGCGLCGPSYCSSNPNSTGRETGLSFVGSPVAAMDDLTLIGSRLPTHSFGYFITSQTQGFVANPGGSQGNLCLAGDLGRLFDPGQIKASDPTGRISLSTAAGEWSLTAIPTSTGSYSATVGTQSHFQLWHRDLVNGAATSNLSEGRTITWQ